MSNKSFAFDEQCSNEHEAFIDLTDGDLSTVYGSVVIRKTAGGIIVDVRDIHGETGAWCKATWDKFNAQENSV